MSIITFPTTTNATAEKIRGLLTKDHFSILFEIPENAPNIGFHHMLPDDATPEVLEHASNISAMLAGIFLLSEEDFMVVVNLANRALVQEAMENPELREKMEAEMEEDFEEDTEIPEYLN